CCLFQVMLLFYQSSSLRLMTLQHSNRAERSRPLYATGTLRRVCIRPAKRIIPTAPIGDNWCVLPPGARSP
ncbi:hypothetical protein AVDCRST_MAG94-3386, partial [uncultured Leptolyngbya sp.]